MVTFAYSPAKAIADMITDSISDGGHNCVVAGSIRRGAKRVSDIDIVVEASNFKAVSIPDYLRLERGGDEYRRYSVTLGNGTDIGVDIWRCPNAKQFGGYTLFATGTAEYNIMTRRVARMNGYRLNQAGLWEGNKHLALSEEGIITRLGLPYLTPSERNRWKSNTNHNKKEGK